VFKRSKPTRQLITSRALIVKAIEKLTVLLRNSRERRKRSTKRRPIRLEIDQKLGVINRTIKMMRRAIKIGTKILPTKTLPVLLVLII